ncbi:LysR family transcriptional regulator [Planomonospora sp. ID67723]|uniref:LysR family transcriptional regulator n=1 Tax=Planomonospora sp. ID67723 TaxID=2738134 RepID=UPI0018C44FCA|nr:LysR substrate-binding domain-containing protein [Planomonospora sp. ID67723]MBG0832437.1 LysR family transcriptional regulator [Planomonospora sp. ID67723]
MTLTQLRTFLAVAETGSVRAAAERLYVTQSAVSAALVALQRSLGLRLVRPAGRGLRLTEAGEVYAEYVRRVLGLLEEARTAAAGEADPERGQVRVAAVTTAGEELLPPLLAGFRNRHPGVGIILEVGNRERVHAMLAGHEADLVVGGRPPASGPFRVLAVRRNELAVVAAGSAVSGCDDPADRADPAGSAARSGLAASTPAPAPADAVTWLGCQTWLLREPGSGTRATTEALLEGLGITPRTLTIGSNVAVRESVKAGLGVTLLSRDAMTEGMVEIPTPLTPMRRDWHLLAHRGPLPATPRLLVEHVLRLSPQWRQRPDPQAGHGTRDTRRGPGPG